MFSRFKICFFLFSFINASPSGNYAQQNWLNSGGSKGNDEALDNCIDKNGNVYSTGYFSLSAKFGNDVLSSSGSGDIFITKQNTSGNYVWAIKAGGANSDRSYGIATDIAGNIYVTGVFSETATFGSFTLNSSGGSQDIFVAKTDPSGNFIWVKQFGGPDIDVSASIDVDSMGNSVITGRFRGTALFDSFSFSSSINSSTNLPGYDIFITRIDPNGNVIWAKQGIAEYDDRGLGVSIDGSGNIFLAGQFSKAISFSNLYSNNSYNACFIMKLDTAGNEVWFRRLLASQVTIYDIRCSGESVYFTGDFNGLLTIFGNSNTNINTPYPNKIFIVMMDGSGNVVWSAADGSDNEISAYSIAVDDSGSAYITGNFKCVFTEYSLAYGNGIFNSVGFRDVFIAKYGSTGQRIWERQFGGPGNDYCAAISVQNPDAPVIAGSFETNFSVPDGGNFLLNAANHDSSAYGPIQNSNFCSDVNYNKYISVYSSGSKDVFSSNPVDLSRLPYDFFDRTNMTCARDTLIPFINNNLDTVIACDSALLFVTRRTGFDGVIGPEYNYLWSNDSITDSTYVHNTGMHWVNFEYKDGCRSFRDSIYVIIEVTPPLPSIQSTKDTIMQAVPINGCFNKLIVVSPDFPYLFCDNIPTGYSYVWTTPNGLFWSDSVFADVGGIYTLTVSTPDGFCQSISCVEVLMYEIANCLPQLFVPEIHFLDSVSEVTDTVKVCPRGFFDLLLTDSASWAQHSSLFLPAFVQWTITGGFQFYPYVSYPLTFSDHYQSFQALYSGNCSVTAVILNPLTGQPFISVTRNFYLDVVVMPPFFPQWQGPDFVCPGDTIILSISGSVGDNIISGPGIISESGDHDSIRVVQSGTYTAKCFVTEYTYGCRDSINIVINVNTSPEPQITLVPANGLICPNDSVQLNADSGSVYEWNGPLGQLSDTTPLVFVSAPGFYHYDFIDSHGCSLISEFIELKEYNTPDLTAEPGTEICPGESVTITVETNDSSVVQWQLPFTDSSFTQVVDSPGTYSCSILSCGINSLVSITITYADIVSQIYSSGPDTICPGDTLILSADTGEYFYNWQPGNSDSSFINVTQAGTYFLELKNAHGCSDMDSVQVDTFSLPMPPVVHDYTICAGDSAYLTAIANGILSWYDSANSDTVIFLGDTFITLVEEIAITYYVINSDANCSSEKVPLTVFVNQISQWPEITSDSIVCSGDTFSFFGPSIQNAAFSWTGPNGFSSQQQDTVIFPFDSTKTGYYLLQISDTMCTSPADSVFADVYPLLEAQISSDAQTICPGDSAKIFSSFALISYYWLPNGNTDSFIFVTDSVHYLLLGTDNNGCTDTSESLNIKLYPETPFPLVSDTNICNDSSVTLVAIGEEQIFWYDENLQVLDSGISFTTPFLNNSYFCFVAQIDSNYCRSEYDSVFVNIYPLLPPPEIISNSPVCDGNSLYFFVDSVENASFIWSGPDGFFSSTFYNIFVADSSKNGLYVYQSTYYGCKNGSDSVDLKVISYPDFDLGPDTLICSGSSVSLTVPSLYDDYLWNTGSAGSTLEVTTPGIFSITATNFPSCSLTKEITIDTITCNPTIPNIFTPNGDGLNDYFFIADMPIKEMQLVVFNRWGQKILESNDAKIKWDGKDNTGNKVPDGVYYFIAHYTDMLNRNFENTGYIQLIR